MLNVRLLHQDFTHHCRKVPVDINTICSILGNGKRHIIEHSFRRGRRAPAKSNYYKTVRASEQANMCFEPMRTPESVLTVLITMANNYYL